MASLFVSYNITFFLDEGLSDDDESDENYQFLLLNDQPWTDVEAKWTQTRARRMRKLSTLSQNEEYVALFPCLRKPLGYKLVRNLLYFVYTVNRKYQIITNCLMGILLEESACFH